MRTTARTLVENLGDQARYRRLAREEHVVVGRPERVGDHRDQADRRPASEQLPRPQALLFGANPAGEREARPDGERDDARYHGQEQVAEVHLLVRRSPGTESPSARGRPSRRSP